VKILGISDLHGNLPDIKASGDILCIAGDICPATDHSFKFQKKWMSKEFIPWCESLIKKGDVKNVCFVAGNHDWYFEHLYNYEKEREFTKTLPEDIHYLRDSEVIIDGFRIYGTPWQPDFCGWAFNRNERSLNDIFSRIPEGLDVLISHGPPYGYCDTVTEVFHHPVTGDVKERQSEHLGSKALNNVLRAKLPKLALVGHIHTGNHKGARMIDPMSNTPTLLSCCVVNVSYLNEQYNPAYSVYSTEL